MKIQHIILNTGEVALVVNNMVVMNGDNSDDSAKLVETVAENLAQACYCALQRITKSAPTEGSWNWDGVVIGLQYEVRPTMRA